MYYDYIKIYGLDGGIAECFQGLGAAALYGDAKPGTAGGGDGGGDGGDGGGDDGETPGIEAMSEAIWAAQSAVLTQQSKFLDELGQLYASKKAELPETTSLWDWFVQESVEFFAGLLGGAIAVKLGFATGGIGVAAAGEVGSWIASFLMYAYDELEIRYNEGTMLCEHIAQENTALLELTNSRENYLLRSTIIVQHEHTIANVSRWIQNAEKAAKDAATGDLTTVEQALKDLQYNGERLQLPDGSIMTLIGKSMILEEA